MGSGKPPPTSGTGASNPEACTPGTAWKRPGLPTQWMRVLERHPHPEGLVGHGLLYGCLLAADAEHDTTAFKQLLAPTYRFITPRGDTVLTRADRVAIAARDTSHRTPPVLQGCQFQFYEAIAVAQCRYTGTVRSASRDSTVNFVSLVVFNERGGRWQILASHLPRYGLALPQISLEC